jgi:hypothetical protein
MLSPSCQVALLALWTTQKETRLVARIRFYPYVSRIGNHTLVCCASGADMTGYPFFTLVPASSAAPSQGVRTACEPVLYGPIRKA